MMTVKFVSFLLAACLACAVPVQAEGADDAVLLAQVAQLVTPSQGLEAHFTLERTIPVLSRPLKSAGMITIGHNGGVTWAQETPYAVTLEFTAQGMTEIMSDGTETVADNPMVAGMGQIFMSLMSGNPAMVSAYFLIKDVTLEGEHWTILLQPKAQMLQAALSQIEISGDRDLKEVLIADSQGGQSHIIFTAHSRKGP